MVRMWSATPSTPPAVDPMTEPTTTEVPEPTPTLVALLKLGDEGSKVRDAILASGLLGQFPEIDLDQNQVGIFGKITRLDTPLADGNRVEIYRPITADPETVERRDQD